MLIICKICQKPHKIVLNSILIRNSVFLTTSNSMVNIAGGLVDTKTILLQLFTFMHHTKAIRFKRAVLTGFAFSLPHGRQQWSVCPGRPYVNSGSSFEYCQLCPRAFAGSFCGECQPPCCRTGPSNRQVLPIQWSLGSKTARSSVKNFMCQAGEALHLDWMGKGRCAGFHEPDCRWTNCGLTLLCSRQPLLGLTLFDLSRDVLPLEQQTSSPTQLGDVCMALEAKLGCLGFGNHFALQVTRLRQCFFDAGLEVPQDIADTPTEEDMCAFLNKLRAALQDENLILHYSGTRGSGTFLSLVLAICPEDVLVEVNGGIVMRGCRDNIMFSIANSQQPSDDFASCFDRRTQRPYASMSDKASQQHH